MSYGLQTYDASGNTVFDSTLLSAYFHKGSSNDFKAAMGGVANLVTKPTFDDQLSTGWTGDGSVVAVSGLDRHSYALRCTSNGGAYGSRISVAVGETLYGSYLYKGIGYCTIRFYNSNDEQIGIYDIGGSLSSTSWATTGGSCVVPSGASYCKPVVVPTSSTIYVTEVTISRTIYTAFDLVITTPSAPVNVYSSVSGDQFDCTYSVPPRIVGGVKESPQVTHLSSWLRDERPDLYGSHTNPMQIHLNEIQSSVDCFGRIPSQTSGYGFEITGNDGYVAASHLMKHAGVIAHGTATAYALTSDSPASTYTETDTGIAAIPATISWEPQDTPPLIFVRNCSDWISLHDFYYDDNGKCIGVSIIAPLIWAADPGVWFTPSDPVTFEYHIVNSKITWDMNQTHGIRVYDGSGNIVFDHTVQPLNIILHNQCDKRNITINTNNTNNMSITYKGVTCTYPVLVNLPVHPALTLVTSGVSGASLLLNPFTSVSGMVNFTDTVVVTATEILVVPVNLPYYNYTIQGWVW